MALFDISLVDNGAGTFDVNIQVASSVSAISESASSSDSTNASVDRSASVSESVTSSESVAGSNVTLSTVSETANARAYQQLRIDLRINFGGISALPSLPAGWYQCWDNTWSSTDVTYQLIAGGLAVVAENTGSNYWGFTNQTAKSGDQYPTGNNGYPNEAIGSWWFVQNRQAAIRLTGLDPSKKYNIAVSGCRPNVVDNRETITTIHGQQVTKTSSRSWTDTVFVIYNDCALFTDISPDSNGDIRVTIENNNNQYGYLNVLEIKQHIEDAVVSESASPSDSVNGTIGDVVSVVSETASSSDSVDRLYTGQGAIAETTSPSEVAAGSKVTLSTVAETTSPSESTSGSKVTLSTVAETSSPSDTTDGSVVSVGVSNVDESTSPSEVVSGSKVTLSTASETTSPSESTSGSKVTLSTVAETTSPVDSVNRLYTGQGAITETSSPSESTAGSKVTLSTVAETTSPADSVNRTKQITASVSESASATDTVDRSKATDAIVSESTTSSDTVNSTRVILASRSEAVAAEDSVNFINSGIFVSIVENTSAFDWVRGNKVGVFRYRLLTEHRIGNGIRKGSSLIGHTPVNITGHTVDDGIKKGSSTIGDGIIELDHKISN